MSNRDFVVEKVERIRALPYLLKILDSRSVRAHRAMKEATTSQAFNAAVRATRALDDLIVLSRQELFDLTEIQP